MFKDKNLRNIAYNWSVQISNLFPIYTLYNIIWIKLSRQVSDPIHSGVVAVRTFRPGPSDGFGGDGAFAISLDGPDGHRRSASLVPYWYASRLANWSTPRPRLSDADRVRLTSTHPTGRRQPPDRSRGYPARPRHTPGVAGNARVVRADKITHQIFILSRSELALNRRPKICSRRLRPFTFNRILQPLEKCVSHEKPRFFSILYNYYTYHNIII